MIELLRGPTARPRPGRMPLGFQFFFSTSYMPPSLVPRAVTQCIMAHGEHLINTCWKSRLVRRLKNDHISRLVSAEHLSGQPIRIIPISLPHPPFLGLAGVLKLVVIFRILIIVSLGQGICQDFLQRLTDYWVWHPAEAYSQMSNMGSWSIHH